jgi:hypothetical protein
MDVGGFDKNVADSKWVVRLRFGQAAHQQVVH